MFQDCQIGFMLIFVIRWRGQGDACKYTIVCSRLRYVHKTVCQFNFSGTANLLPKFVVPMKLATNLVSKEACISYTRAGAITNY